LRGSVDVALIRREERSPGLAFKLLIKEPLVVLMPRDHPLTARKAIRPKDLAGEAFVRPSKVAPALNAAIDDYAARSRISLKADHEVENLSMAVALIASTRSIGLVPIYARNLLPPTVVTRPLEGDAPTIDLVIGYSKASTSPVLKRFLSKVDDLVTRVAEKSTG
jgi:LysR family hca operon transcriptional activator